MLVKPPIEELLKKVSNRYSLTYVVAKRARQLVSGAKLMTNSTNPNLVTLACEEIASDQVVAVPRLVSAFIPKKDMAYGNADNIRNLQREAEIEKDIKRYRYQNSLSRNREIQEDLESVTKIDDHSYVLEEFQQQETTEMYGEEEF